MQCEPGLDAPDSTGGFRAAAGGKRGQREGRGLEVRISVHILMCETVLLGHFLSMQQGWLSGSQSIS